MAAVHNAIVCPGGKQLGKDIRSVAVAVCQLVASAQIFIRPNWELHCLCVSPQGRVVLPPNDSNECQR